MQEQVTIFLTPIDAKLFMDFQKYHEAFEAMIKNGVFDIRFGSCTLNFADKKVMNITKNEMVWKR